MPKTLVFTATYNEAQNVSQWVEGVVRAVPDADILVIDDSSPDGTGEVLEDLRSQIPQLEVVHRAGKSGLASAHLRAVDIALAGDYDMLVTMDADGSHQPNQVVDLLHAMDGADFIIGTRYRGGSHQAGTFRRILSLGANRLTMAVLPTGLSEYTTSFRVFNRRAMQTLSATEFHAGGYAFFVECVEILHRDGLTLREVPIDFIDRVHGDSKIPKTQIAMSMAALASLGWARWKRS